MNWRRIKTIFTKDLRDAIRDARVLVAIVVPIGISIFYSLAFDDSDPTRPRVAAAYAVEAESELPEVLSQITAADVDLVLVRANSAAEVEALVREDEVDLGFSVPADFDEAAKAGLRPLPDLFLPDDSSTGTRYVAAVLVGPAVRVVAGQQVPAEFGGAAAAIPETSTSILEQLGIRSYTLLASVLFLVVMISMLVVPVVLAEEAEKKTLDALVLIASYLDVIAAKALFGASYIVLALAIQLGLTRLVIDERVPFAATLAALSVTLIGFGLLIGSIFKNANQLNTWSGFLLIPFLAPVFAVGMPVPDFVEALLQLFPTSAGMRLAINDVTGESLFANPWLSYLVIVAWGAVAYLALAWRLNRRQA
jgi:ABC-2 type transport system permease protein